MNCSQCQKPLPMSARIFNLGDICPDCVEKERKKAMNRATRKRKREKDRRQSKGHVG